MRQKFTVTGMTCSACSAHVEKAVSKLEGVSAVNVNLLGGSMQVDFDPAQQSDDSIIAAVVASGYGAQLPNTQAQTGSKSSSAGVPDMKEELAAMKRRLIISFIFFVPLFYLCMGHMYGWPIPAMLSGHENMMIFSLLQLLLLLPIMYVNDKYYKVGFKTLWHRSPNMDSLIALGSTAAIVYSLYALFQLAYGFGHGDMALVEKYHMEMYFESAGTILTLVTLGKYMETKSKGKTGEAIARLMDLAPKTATVVTNGVEVELPVEQVAVGDLILVRPGQAIPVDGEIVDGSSTIDESALTGESIPVDKGPGDKVAAAAINKSGSFTFRATRVGDDTTLAQMIALVDEAASSKAPIAKLADKVAGVFVPVVIALATITAIVWMVATGDVAKALTSGVAVLVISCPCALGLATPVAIMVGTGKGADNGILFKSAEALENLRSIQVVVLDKTGTVTQGQPVVTDIQVVGNTTESELLCVAGSLEKPSEHPLAQAIVARVQEQGIPLVAAEGFSAVHGRGVTATIQGAQFLAGNQAMMEEHGIDLTATGDAPQRLAEEGKTPLYFAKGQELIGLVAVADTVKPTSAAAISAMRELGLDVVMLTGDNRRTANAIAKELALTEVVAEVLPQDKERVIADLQAKGKKVAMIGDGINDAPALARSDVGLAIGAGTDVAIESADVVLMKSDLMDAVTAVELSRATIRNIKQNLFWAFFYNVICIPIAAGVLALFGGPQLDPQFGAAAMAFSSVTVVSNALRLKLFKPRHTGDRTYRPQSAPAVIVAESQPEPKQQEGKVPTMEKKIMIEGMMCQNCVKHVSNALNALPGVTAVVDLEGKCATVTGEVDNETLTKAVVDAGYEVVSIA